VAGSQAENRDKAPDPITLATPWLGCGLHLARNTFLHRACIADDVLRAEHFLPFLPAFHPFLLFFLPAWPLI
jgi:hypothetical protein